ncbi:putative sh3 domain-containing protein [Erysiphe neolycopersici]|uniref:Putative sh3 domain-containing protein n=1 Tax=Erysiphe neolycopersici TaxID=212602 RepID=A0A420HTQ0_9PEZI|nr:putative sh3 domain-containing protein [Erysiphe neolycopersici]
MSPTITSSSYSNPSSLLPLITPQQIIYSESKRPLSTSHATKHSRSDYSSSPALAISNSVSDVSSDPPSIQQPYTMVRDFAYSISHPMHYGTMIYSSQPSSGFSTPASQSPEFLSDLLDTWENNSCWGSRSFADELIGSEQVAQINFGDGPPWSEDEDLQSPVVVSSRHRKYKSSGSSSSLSLSSCGEKRRSIKESEEKMNNSVMMEPTKYEHNGRYFLSPSENDCKRFYFSQDDEKGGPRSEIIAYSTEKARHFDRFDKSNRRDSHFAGTLPKRSYADVIRDFNGPEISSTPSSPDSTPREDSRYSRDYQFTITSSDEEMHGQAVALFNFKSENENELPLIEGQIIWVSYRYGEGWLVAEDPKSRESGLVPEAYVKLLRDIHGDLSNTCCDRPAHTYDISARI